ncbi:hypothetical protein ISN44_As10g008760 [Arabidopsis suecica]|uniref:Uncharacterized protein n=1 Tax=Arabidopsis suecica TaxID=45249 RepID=A0A8T1ZVU3_ARASU|nr:hypothetical protein ISN44_As10g008760 [Arabidopsis suecica]
MSKIDEMFLSSWWTNTYTVPIASSLVSMPISTDVNFSSSLFRASCCLFRASIRFSKKVWTPTHPISITGNDRAPTKPKDAPTAIDPMTTMQNAAPKRIFKYFLHFFALVYSSENFFSSSENFCFSLTQFLQKGFLLLLDQLELSHELAAIKRISHGFKLLQLLQGLDQRC